MTKKFLLCVLFFGFSPLLLGLSFYLTNLPLPGKVLGEARVSPPAPNYIFTALPEVTGAVAPTIKAADSTPVVIEKYLKRYNSPLLPYSYKIVEAGRKYNVNPRLIVAIAQQESNLGKKSPENCYNAWGWGIHERGTRCFSGWEEAIDTVTRGISNGYCSKGLCDDPCTMMKKYTPKSNGSWCAGVNQFLNEMEFGDF
jgi:hypothetical protein